MIRGGIADKLGNDYEGLWALNQALQVLHGFADEIRLEPFDEGGAGFEFRVRTGDADVWHQCKRRRVSGSWTIRALEVEEVLAAFARKLPNPRNTCVFVSSDGAQALKTLLDKASLVEGLAPFVASLGDADALELKALRTAWNVDDTTAFDWLRRCRVETVSTTSLLDQIDSICRLTFSASAKLCRERLAAYLDDHLTIHLTTAALRDAVQGLDLGWKAGFDPTLDDRLARATDDYLGTLTLPLPTTVVDGAIAPVVAEALDGPAKIVVVAGGAGSGKSLAMSSIVASARQRDWPILALRVDRFLACQSPEELGEVLLDRRQSPVGALGNRHPRRPTVLLIDQVDAVSEASGRSSQMRDQIFRMIEDSGLYRQMKVVIACRSYDLEHDRRLGGQASLPWSKAIKLEPLAWDNGVLPVLKTLGLGARSYSDHERRLLAIPINLQLFARLHLAGERVDGELSAARLFDRLLEVRAREFRELGIPWTPQAALGQVAVHMSDNQELTAPPSVVAAYPGALDHLASAGLITVAGGKLQFAHESFFDHVFASNFIASGVGVPDLLRRDEQRLFRRTQVRQIFSRLRDQGARSYLGNLRAVIEAEDVRYLVKDAVAQWLGAIDDPTPAERRLVDGWFQDGHRYQQLARIALTGVNWTQTLIDGGQIRRWLDDGGDRKALALWALRRAAVTHAAVIAPLLREWWGRDEARTIELTEWFQALYPEGEIGALADLYADLINAYPKERLESQGFWTLCDLGPWESKKQGLGPRVLDLWLTKWMRERPDDHPFDENINQNGEHWLREVADGHPLAFARSVLPHFSRACVREQERLASGDLPHPTIRVPLDPDLRDSVVSNLKRALEATARQDADLAAALLDEMTVDTGPIHLLRLAAIAANPSALAMRLPALIRTKGIFEIGYSSAAWRPFAGAAKAAFPHLPEAVRGEIECAIFAYRPELDYARDCAKREPGSLPAGWGPTKISDVLSHTGRDERAILDTIGRALLTPTAQRRLDELDRKFRGQPHPKAGGGGGMVRSPIPEDRVRLMSDEAWLSAMDRYKDESGHIYMPDHVVGGARQLASTLGTLAKEQPARFAALLKRMPASLNPQYAESIVHGLGESNGDGTSIAEAIFFALRNPDAECGRFVAWTVRRHPDAARDQSIFDMMLTMAESGNANDRAVGSPSGEARAKTTVGELLRTGGNAEANSINEERGSAFEALSAVLWQDGARLDAIASLLDRRIEAEPLSSVRMAMLSTINSVAKHDVAVGLDLLNRVGRHDPETLLSRNGRHILRWAKHQDGYDTEITTNLIASPTQSHQALGLLIEASNALADDQGAQTFLTHFHTPLARQVAAFIARDNLEAGPIGDRSSCWLETLWNDPDPEVRAEAGRVAWRNVLAAESPRRSLVACFVTSAAFDDDPGHFLHDLQGWVPSYPDATLTAVRNIIARSRDQTPEHRRARYMSTHYLGGTLVALYRLVESDPDQERELLDLFDEYLASDHYDIRSHIGSYERH
ncbi:MAG: hypothetical protein J7521_07170 [Caulobacter sp.]|nr:hypothetical protein [Caulobacter sp.]